MLAYFLRGLVIGFSIAAPAGPIGLSLHSPHSRSRPRGGLTLGLTLTNPSTVLSFMAIFAGLGLGTSGAAAGGGDYAGAAVLVGGVFLGSGLWWLILSGITSALRGRISPAGMRWVNRLSGAILTAFGLMALIAL